MDTSNTEQLHIGRIPSTSTVVLSPDENFEEFTLIWLDSDVNKTTDCIDTKDKLKQLIHFVLTFDNTGTCLEYMRSIHTEKILFIVSGKLGKVILVDIQDLHQILFIYIFCENKMEHENWSKNYPNKLQGVFTDKDDLLSKLIVDLKIISMNSMPFSVFDLTTNESTIQDLNNEKVTFLWFHLLIEALLQIKYDNINAKNEMVRECCLYYKNNKLEKERIYEFNSTYIRNSATRWYTRDCFLYRLINKALRTQNIDIIFKFRFFIKDLYIQLKTEYALQFNNGEIHSFSVYRGQLMPLYEIEKLQKNIGGYCSINTFLSTTTSSIVAASFAGSGGGRPVLESVLFEINIDINNANSNNSLTPFANIAEVSHISDEKEILFSIGTVFKIENVEQLSDVIWNVELVLSEQIDKNIQKLIEFYKQKLHENNTEASISDLAWFLVEMGDYNKAEKYYQLLLEEFPKNNNFSDENQQIEIGRLHIAIGQIYYEKGNYDQAMRKYELALAIVSPYCVSTTASIYNNMGLIYRTRDDDEMALKIYEKALELCSTLPETFTLAMIYNNIAAIYQKNKTYEITLEYYQKSLAIKKKLCPPNHPYLITIYNNIGTLCFETGEYDMALEYFNNVLNMGLSVLPALHIGLASSYNNIATVYDEKSQYSNALIYYYKALDIYLANSVSNHQDLSSVYTNIALNEKYTGNYLDAIAHYQLALDIELNYSNKNALTISDLYQLMGDLYEKINKSHEAVAHYEKSLVYRSQSSVSSSDQEWFIHMHNIIGNSYKLQRKYTNALEHYIKTKTLMLQVNILNNIDFAAICHNIANTSLENDGNIENALKIYDDAVDYLNYIQEFTREHFPIVVTIYYNIAKLYFEKKNIDIALIYYQKVLELRCSYMIENDPSIGTTFNNIGMCYIQKGDLNQAIFNFKHALEIYLSNGDSEQLNVALCYNNIAIVFINHGKYIEAIEVMNRSIEIKKTAYRNNLVTSEYLASAYKFLATIYEQNRNYLYAYLNYIESLKKLLTSDNCSMIIEIHRSIGRINMQAKRYTEAINHYEKALERSSNLDELIISTIYNDIGSVYCSMKNMKMALRYYNMSLNIQLKKFSTYNVSIANTFNLLGEAYSLLNDFTEAIIYHAKAIKIILSTSISNDSFCCTELITAYNRLACIYCQQRSYQEALLYLALTLETQFKYQELNAMDDEITNRIATTFTSIASLYCLQTKYNEALLYYEKALCYGLIQLFKFGDNKRSLLSKLVRILDNIAYVWYKKDDRSRALSYLQAAIQILFSSTCPEDQNFVIELRNKIEIINKQLWILGD
ncbi:unnamed protein product [Adineta ricciae]|uniref:Uncharacterized protein n=1 Tax=Adineta ricciae TaxID=249248 RepID=A0A815X7P9_ADIRI|nr:unnamed protein product [Adineta ricciae]CAF1554026.1 unnamed protein product [Adineta ricciae]